METRKPGNERLTTTRSLRLLGKAAYTLFFIPRHERIYREIAADTHNTPLPPELELQPDISSVCREIDDSLTRRQPQRGQLLGKHEQIALSAQLIQFSDHLVTIPDHLKLPYRRLEYFFEATTVRRQELEHRLSFGDQLDLALDHTDNSLDEALYLLVMSSRMYARWLDSASLTDMPHYDHAARKDMMIRWQDALQTCKNDGNYHDTAGDTYYAWTHAYAQYVFRCLSRTPFKLDPQLQHVFANGTTIMQTCVNAFTPRGVMSNHDIAAEYGNAIGATISDHVATAAEVNRSTINT